ncbi:YadA family autotransporter adhesin [Xenorhabdus sp. KK7.4]|uniref:YadA family autotransporter adhesin n=1 Tax=Xenorhabdus sp. KK7.4 TaxID=1851572 RepID=UPI000C03B633|nr:hypothetical protein [Xenorhabdus sp. KK7.4]PHM52080.1 adhesin YadA [Xenorhabdus sp. KK7.4]
MSCCENDRTLGNRPMRRGEPGESAYEFWKEQQPPGSDTSPCAFEKFMEGKTGESAYEFWKSRQLPGTDTSEQAFADSMKGKIGPTVEDKISAKDQSIITQQTIVDETHKTTTIGVQLSGKKENALTLEKDGLFSPLSESGKLVFDATFFSGKGTQTDPYKVMIDNSQTNILGWSPNGLNVPLLFDSNAFNFVQGYNVQLRISKKAGNTLTVETDGLFGKGEAVVSAKKQNILSNKDDGLYVPEKLFHPQQFQHLPANSKPDDPSLVALLISSNIRNGLTFTDDGLYVVGVPEEIPKYLSLSADAEDGDDGAIAADNVGGVALGSSAQATAKQTVAIGTQANSQEDHAVSVGGYSVARENSIAIGYRAEARPKGSVAIGYKSRTNDPDTVSIGNYEEDLQRRLTNVKAGVSSYDAVNVGQLQKLVNVKELPSTKANPVDFNTLKGPMTYIIWEGDYDAEKNPSPHTMKNAPDYDDRSDKIKVIVSDNGSYQIAHIPTGVVIRDFNNSNKDLIDWAEPLTSNMGQVYKQDVSGVYWGASNYVFYKEKEDKIFNEEAVNAIFSGFRKVNAQADSVMGKFGGGVLGFAEDGRVKFYLDHTELGSTTSPEYIYSLAAISDKYKNDPANMGSVLPTGASLDDVRELLNLVTMLLYEANMFKFKPSK